MSESALMLQFLEWVSSADRTYDQAMNAWRSSCPRLTIWEDALAAGLVEVTGTDRSSVRLTALGRTTLAR